MQVSYTCLKKKVAFFSKQLTVAIGLLALPIAVKSDNVAEPAPATPTKPAQPVNANPTNSDPRADRIKTFLSRLHCPVAALAEEFVNAADENSLDWRLLPSISVIESGGGKAYRNNNIFGWNNGSSLFPTICAGIHEVAYKLGKSTLYRNRDAAGKLRMYNPDPDYASRVLSVMHRISPIINLKPTSRLVQRQDQFVYSLN
jgi:flagellum-specific peptidoglycan hydrolase FlgJ